MSHMLRNVKTDSQQELIGTEFAKAIAQIVAIAPQTFTPSALKHT